MANLARMSAAELRKYATENLGMTIHQDAVRDTIIAAIRAHQGEANVVVSEEASAKKSAKGDDASEFVDFTKRPDLRRPTHALIINADPNDPMASHQFVSVNGFAWHIKRGVEVAVPKVVIDGLNAAESELLINTGKKNVEGQVIYLRRKVKRISFTARPLEPGEAGKIMRSADQSALREAQRIVREERIPADYESPLVGPGDETFVRQTP